MATYRPGVTSAALGGLLRLAQQEKETQPHRVPPSAQESSPVRAQVQAPISAPESVGSQKVVALKPELNPSAEIPTPAGAPGVVGPRPDAAAPGVVGPTASAPGVNPISGPSAGAPTPRVLGASVSGGSMVGGGLKLPSTLLPSALRGGSMQLAGRLQANEVPQVTVRGPAGASEFGSKAAFEKAQTPEQNILGGIGKVGTAVTSALRLPQLLPGGAFKKLQDIMAPLKAKGILPNFNYNKS